MTEIDDRIDAALRAEEERLLAQIGEEAPFLDQARDLFVGPNAWVSTAMMVAQIVLFVAGVWAGWRFFQAETALEALRWGLPSAVLLLMSLVIKMGLVPMMAVHSLRRDLADLARR